MSWIKLGLIFKPPVEVPWVVTHSAVPVALHLKDSLYRVYFTARDGLNRSHIGYFEIDLKHPHKLLSVTTDPIVSPGALGTFDEHGAMSSWLVPWRNKCLMYYTGWSRGLSVPFVNSIGLAVSDDGGKSFSKFSDGPILSRNLCDPYWVSNPCVLVEKDLWRMWYLSGVRWELDNGKPVPYYHIRYAHSHDGIHWVRSGKICIDFESPRESAISRPCVLKGKSIYRMWYSFRGASYRIGYAESVDGLSWVRRDALAGISVSESGWDSDMIEYAYVFRHAKRFFMLYNGNDYGRTGIGLAVLREDA